MATGHDIQTARQIGEHLVAAELGRMGYVAAPFAGNVPFFDLLAANSAGRTVPIQVKAIRGQSWQCTANQFLKVELLKSGRQMVRGPTELLNPKLICVFVRLGKRSGDDRFYIFLLRDLQRYFQRTYKSRRRPRNPKSLHCAIWEKDLIQFQNNWDLIKEVLGRPT